MNEVHPLARQASLIVKEVENETLVYDLETDKAHCLNETAARVWRLCDGHNSVSEIARRLSAKATGTVDENVISLALDQLEKFKLLEQPREKRAYRGDMSRRQLVRTLGVAAIVLPMVTSILVPVAAQQASCLKNGQPCEGEEDERCCGNCQLTGQSFVCNSAGQNEN